VPTFYCCKILFAPYQPDKLIVGKGALPSNDDRTPNIPSNTQRKYSRHHYTLFLYLVKKILLVLGLLWFKAKLLGSALRRLMEFWGNMMC
jgi:hypothetical protein